MWVIAVAGDKNYRRVGAFHDNPSLQIQSTEVPDRDVQHQAVWHQWPGPGKELSANANVCDCQPSQRINDSRDSRTEASL